MSRRIVASFTYRAQRQPEWKTLDPQLLGWLAGVRARSNLNIQIGQISIATLNEHQYDEARHE